MNENIEKNARAPKTASPHLVSIVMPAYEEETGIGRAVREIDQVMAACSQNYELIVVDDGSSDHTYEAVARLTPDYPAVRGIRFSRNFGKEAALLAGLDAASGDVIVTIDSDLQHPPSLIQKMVDEWRKGAKVVHAVKQDRSTDSALARWRAVVFNSLMVRLGGIDIHNSSDYKLLDRMVVDVIVRQLPERRRFYRGLADWVGYEQVTVPFTVTERSVGESKWSLLALVDLATTAIVSFTSAPLRIVTFLGFITMVFGVLVGAEAMWSWIHGESVSGFATMIITLLIIGSFIMISLGIVGEYIAKIYDEIKDRPVYLVESKCGFIVDPPCEETQHETPRPIRSTDS